MLSWHFLGQNSYLLKKTLYFLLFNESPGGGTIRGSFCLSGCHPGSLRRLIPFSCESTEFFTNAFPWCVFENLVVHRLNSIEGRLLKEGIKVTAQSYVGTMTVLHLQAGHGSPKRIPPQLGQCHQGSPPLCQNALFSRLKHHEFGMPDN